MKLSEIIGTTIALRRSGREWKGISPFTGQLAFFVSDEKALWLDLSTGRNGGAVEFLMATRGIGADEAAAVIAGMEAVEAGVVH
jgi:DNA primase